MAYCHTSGARGARNSNRAGAAEIRELLGRLGLEPWDIARTGEALAGELGMKGWARDADARERWISALAEHPVLIQRPIITAEDGTALVARSEQAVRDALGRCGATTL
ncbi:ArsC/Spx/MgsR family protein [Streptomyces bauhiniae]|uniref:ArsC/Spx/MgsR family protein n=1 Tax=Streptomyces bauhiniae TaxID=2340725 RepID=UPI00332DB03C